MKLLLSIIISIGFVTAAHAAPKEISKRLLNIVKKNHLVVAKVKHPARGIKLFDACFNGNTFESISNKLASRCIEKEWTVTDDDKYDVFPNEQVLSDDEYRARYNGKAGGLKGQYTPMCVKWKKFVPSGTRNRTKSKAVNCRWVLGRNLPWGHYAHGDSEKAHDQFRVCDYKTVPTLFPLTQTIEIYNLHDNTSGNRVYWHSSHQDRAQPGYRKASYTIPFCQDLGDKDFPDTNK